MTRNIALIETSSCHFATLPPWQLEVISCWNLWCLSNAVENSANQKKKALIPHVPGFPSVGWHFPTVPGNTTIPSLAVTNWHFHSTIHTRPRCNFSLQQWTPLSTKNLPISPQRWVAPGTSPNHCVAKELASPTPTPSFLPSFNSHFWPLGTFWLGHNALNESDFYRLFRAHLHIQTAFIPASEKI